MGLLDKIMVASAITRGEYEARLRAQKETLAEAKAEMSGLKAGDRVEGGIYLCRWENPVDGEGNRPGKAVHVIAAPKDLKKADGANLLLNFNDAAKEVGGLRNFYGHDGIYIPNDAELFKGIADSSVFGKWIIPPLEILNGRKSKETPIIVADNIFAHRDAGAFKDSFMLTDGGSDGCPNWYWSCTENRDNRDFVWGVRLSDGNDGRVLKFNFRLSCRPVRLELAL